MAGNAPRQWGPNEWGNYQDRCNLANYQNWSGMNNWWGIPTPPKEKGRCAKGGNQKPMGRSPRTDPGGKAYQDIEWALKTNGGSVAGNMPLLIEFANYVDWEADGGGWASMLHSRPVYMGYFINYLKGIATSVIDKNSGGFAKRNSEE